MIIVGLLSLWEVSKTKSTLIDQLDLSFATYCYRGRQGKCSQKPVVWGPELRRGTPLFKRGQLGKKRYSSSVYFPSALGPPCLGAQ